MQTIEVTATWGSDEEGNKGTATANFNIGETVAEMVDRFGEEVIFSHVRRSLVIACQAYMRSMGDSGKSADEIKASVAEWKPGLRKAAKSPLERARDELARMSPADRQALAKELRARAN